MNRDDIVIEVGDLIIPIYNKYNGLLDARVVFSIQAETYKWLYIEEIKRYDWFRITTKEEIYKGLLRNKFYVIKGS